MRGGEAEPIRRLLAGPHGEAVAPDASQETLRTGGSVELLQLNGGPVLQQEYWLDLGTRTTSAEVDIEPAPTFPGKLGRIGVFGIEMPQAQVSSDPRARTISVSGAPLTLDAQTAAGFNEAFAEGKELFKAGEVAGSLSFTAQGQ